MKCNSCKININDHHKKCPLCNKQLNNKVLDSKLAYPSYKNKYVEIKNFTIKKIFLFVAIVASTITLYINLVSLKINQDLWSLVVIGSVFAAYFYFRIATSKHMNTAGKLFTFFVTTAVLTITIDGSLGFTKWSTTYVLPFATIGITLLLTVLALSKKSRYTDYMGYLICTSFLSLCPIILFLFSLSDEMWTSMSAFVYSFLTLIGLLMFSDRQFKEELKKKFHFN